MFCDNLSASLNNFCKARSLSQESASELCSISPCHFGRIIQKKSVPSIAALEKICTGFKCTPNELLGLADVNQGIVFRLPMRVTAIQLLSGDTSYPICPRCGCTMDREYQAHCDRCGQCLSWERYGADTIVITRP